MIVMFAVDDFMIGDEFDVSDDPPAKPDSDSDFQLGEEDELEEKADSGSDWEAKVMHFAILLFVSHIVVLIRECWQTLILLHKKQT